MRAPKLTIAILTAAAVTACGGKGDSARAAKEAEFKRDLALASATNLDVAAPAVNPALLTLETAPAGAPKPATTIKKAVEGPKVVQSEEPTVQAEPEPQPAAVVEAEPVATVTAPAPAPVESNEPVAVAPRLQPIPAIPAGGVGAGDYGRGGGVFGGGIGVVIRGGGVGDGDHCEIRPRSRGGVYRGPVYVPRPTTVTSAPARPTPRLITVVRRTASR